MSGMTPARVRFAPSPTGYLHIGGLRTALYNYLLARKTGGSFLLRIEDTDQKRFVPDAEADILESLEWAGISFDEGPGSGGSSGPYHQSERTKIYRDISDQLLAQNRAYLAFDTEIELQAMRDRLKTDENTNPRYDFRSRNTMRNSLSLPEEEVTALLQAGVPHVVRLKIEPGKTVSFRDIVRGDVQFETENIDDQVLIKSDALPTYHLANVVDDHLMRITHVIRGEEWLSSTPKHVLLYQSLGWQTPEMAHLPLILSPTGGKLSKRSADRAGIPVFVRDYREAGYEPAALINFLALLGWNPGDERELFRLPELSESFSLERVGQSGVQFDLMKLQWFNEHYLRNRSADDIAAEIQPLLLESGLNPTLEYLSGVVELMRERISLPSDLLKSRYFFEEPTSYDEQAVRKRWKDDSRDLVEAYADKIEAIETFDTESIELRLRELAEDRDIGAGRIIHPVRLTTTGVAVGPGLFELLVMLGQEQTVRRLRTGALELG